MCMDMVGCDVHMYTRACVCSMFGLYTTVDVTALVLQYVCACTCTCAYLYVCKYIYDLCVCAIVYMCTSCDVVCGWLVVSVCMRLCIWQMYDKMTSLCVVVLHVSCVCVYVCVCKPCCCGRQHRNEQKCIDVVCCGAQMAMDMRRCVCMRMC